MKKIIILILILILSLSTVTAIDSSSWEVKKVGDVDFKVPPQYAGGRLSDNAYTVNDTNNFYIACVDSFLTRNYGYNSVNYDYNENISVGGHDTFYFNRYNNYIKDNVSAIYFASGNSIYVINWGGNSISPEIEEIISSAPPSDISLEDFYLRLDQAQSDYLYEKAVDDAYMYDDYPSSFSSKNTSQYGYNSLPRDYFMYSLGRHSR